MAASSKIVALLTLSQATAAATSVVRWHAFGPTSDVELAAGDARWRGRHATADVVATAGRTMHMLPSMLSADEIDQLREAAMRCTAFDVDPDTVDKEATYQAYIFEDGEPTRSAAEVGALLMPIIEQRVLPYVRTKYNCPTACLADGLLRRYVPCERTSLALHYDIEVQAALRVPAAVSSLPSIPHLQAAFHPSASFVCGRPLRPPSFRSRRSACQMGRIQLRIPQAAKPTKADCMSRAARPDRPAASSASTLVTVRTQLDLSQAVEVYLLPTSAAPCLPAADQCSVPCLFNSVGAPV